MYDMSIDELAVICGNGLILQPIAKKKRTRIRKKARAVATEDDMTLKISEREPYIITLDSLDMKYIHTNMETVQPIWSCTQKNYYEFVVVSTDSESDEETESNEVSSDMESEFCHICNVEVPTIFLNEHYNSEKHELHQKLTKTALERAAKSMETCPTINKTDVNHDIYYCATCSVAVLKKHKLIHEKSKQHLNCHKYNESISSLIKVYINRRMSLKNDNEKVNFNNDNDNNNDNNDNIESHNNMLIKHDIERDINKEYSVQDLPTELLKVFPYNSSDSLSVPRNNYHGLVIYDNRIYCKLCRCTLEESVDIHILLNNHLCKSGAPLDNHGIREVNSQVNHCIACNLLIAKEDTNKHCTDDSVHKKLLNGFMAKLDVTVTENSKPSKQTYCKPCNRYIDTHNYPAHVKSKNHKTKTCIGKGDPSPSTIKSVQSNNSSYNNNHLAVGSNPKELNCDVCQVKIPNTKQNINEHFKAKKHQDNLLKLTNDNSDAVLDLISRLVSNDKEDYCDVCKVKLPKTGKSIHELGRNHKNNLLKH